MKRLIFVGLLSWVSVGLSTSICSTVDSSGLTSYGGGVTAEPTDLNDAIICINASNVIVDLGGYVFEQNLANRIGEFTGIRIANDLTNVTVRNGTIANVTGYGISVGEGCQDILFDDITVHSCDKTGIFFNGNISNHINQVVIKDCTVTSCTGASGQPAYGLRVVYGDNVTVNDSTFNHNDAGTTSMGYGASFEWCNTLALNNCVAHSNGGSTLGIGLNLYNTDWATVKDCSFVNNISRSLGSARAIGCLLDTAEHCSILRCLSKHNNNSLAEAYGFQAINGSNNEFRDCSAMQNVGGLQAAGFYLETNEAYSSVNNCGARLNNGGASGVGYGIFLDGAQNCDIIDNEVMRNIGATGYGLVDSVVNTSNLIVRNFSFLNTTTGFEVTRIIGSFPVVSATVGDFSALQNASRFHNVYFTP